MTTRSWPPEAADFNWLVQVEAEVPDIAMLTAFCPDVNIVRLGDETSISHTDLEVLETTGEVWEAVPDLLEEVCTVIRTERADFRWIHPGTKLLQRKSDGSVLQHQRILMEGFRLALIGGNVNMSAGGGSSPPPRHTKTRCLIKANTDVREAANYLARPSTFVSLWNAFEKILSANGLKASQYQKMASPKGSGSCLQADANTVESFYKTAHQHRHPPEPRRPEETWAVMPSID